MTEMQSWATMGVHITWVLDLGWEVRFELYSGVRIGIKRGKLRETAFQVRERPGDKGEHGIVRELTDGCGGWHTGRACWLGQQWFEAF